MKKFGAIILSFLMVLCVAACSTTTTKPESQYKVAMITDYGDITDQSFNQATYEACKEFCEANNVSFKYYEPAFNSTDQRIEKVETAVAEGYNVIVMPGYAFAGTIVEVTAEGECCDPATSGVKIIALDVAKGDLLAEYFGASYNYNPEDPQWASYVLPSNVYCAVYQEEIAGYFAGYAAVKEGFTKLGFLGGMAVPAVQRYGYGFVQGVDAAAQEKSVSVTVNYVYGGQFFGDATIDSAMDTWYAGGTEIVFACGGGIYSSAAKAAAKVNMTNGNTDCKVIGVDTDQSFVINKLYGEITVTSAMKGLAATVKTSLSNLVFEDKFTSKIETLGLVSGTDPESNYVQLPIASWSMKNFSVNDYKALVAKIFSGQVTVSNSTAAHPTVSNKTTVTYLSDLH